MAKQKNNEETKETMWCETQLCKSLHIWPVKGGGDYYLCIVQDLQEVLSPEIINNNLNI